MPLLAGSSSTIPSFTRRQVQTTAKTNNAIEGFTGLLQLLTSVIAVGTTVLFPQLGPAASLFEGLALEALDLNSFFSSSKETQQKRLPYLIVNSLINFSVSASSVRNAFGYSRNIVARGLGSDTTKAQFFTREKTAGFKELYKKARVGEDGFQLIKNRTLTELLATKKIDAEVLKRSEPFEEALQKEFGDVYKKGQRTPEGYNVYSGEFIYTNKDMAILRGISKKIYFKDRYQNRFNAREFFNRRYKRQFITDEEIIERLNGLSYNARKTLKRTSLKESIYDRLTRVSKELYPRTFKQKFNAIFASNRANFITQVGQLGNPNDFAREIVNRPTHWLINKIRVYTDKFFAKFKITRWSSASKRFNAINAELKKLGKSAHIFRSQRFVMGYRIVRSYNGINEVIIFFNPKNTNAKTPGSINFLGKKTVITTISDAHLKFWNSVQHPGNFYLKGGSGFPPIAVSQGGRNSRAFGGIVEGILQQALLASISVGPLRNIFSLVTNSKGVIRDLAKGVYFAKWSKVFEDTVIRLAPHKLAKIAGNVIAAPFGTFAQRQTQRIALGFVKGFQYTKSSTYYAKNGIKLKRTRTLLGGSGFSFNELLKNSIPASFRASALRKLPKSYGGSRAVTSIGANYKGRRTAINVRRVGSVFK